jgi:multicomponent Na+:H+ antiporter subunit D
MDNLVALPVIIPIFASAIAILLRKKHHLQSLWSFFAMAISSLISLYMVFSIWKNQQPLILHIGSWPVPAGITLVGDMLSATMVLMSQVVLSFGMLYALGSKDQCVRYPAFYPMFLSLGAGLTGALLTGDLFNLFVFTELMVISGTVLTAISDDKMGAEAAYKYFFISLIASVFLLMSIGGLYISYGTLNIAQLAQNIALDPDQPLLFASMVFMMAFFMVKSAVVPFHFWQPDFHTAAPTPVHAVLSSVVVKLGVYGFLRMITLIFPQQSQILETVLITLGSVGIFVGGLGAIGTYDVKRMLAYSTLGQIGFILVAIAWNTPLALSAAILYAINHSFIKSAMLMLAGAVASRAPVKTAAFSVITGIGKSIPLVGLLFFIGGMALAGMPPTNGFTSKLLVFQSGIEGSSYLSVIILAVASSLSLIYVFRSFQKIWWEPSKENFWAKTTGDRLLAPILLIVFCLVLGLWSEPLVQLSEGVSGWILQPSSYISAVLGTP